MLANRENNAEALPFLTKAIEAYEDAIAACKAEDKDATAIGEMSLGPLDKYLLRKDGAVQEEEESKDASSSSNIKRIIHGGLELNVLEAGYTQTLFYMA